MSHRRAKSMRQIVIPRERINVVSKTRVSRGAFIRATTCYKKEKQAIIKVKWPLQVLFGLMPVQTYRLVLGESPRRYLQRAKRRATQWASV